MYYLFFLRFNSVVTTINEIPNKVKDLLVVSPVLGRVFGGFLGVDFAPFVLITVNFFSS